MLRVEDLEKPFFHRSANIRLIDELARLDDVAIFAGSGVTVDSTTLTWDDMITYLLRQGGKPKEVAERLVRSLGPAQAGSIAVHMYRQRDGIRQWPISVANDLRPVLYSQRGWLGGRISLAIAELWHAMRKSGKNVRILTTNYDVHIEGAIRDVLHAAGERESQATSAVTYLHGRIPENVRVRDFPVISERDYLTRRDQTVSSLDTAFGTNNVLLVGSGLKDPPLLEALLNTQANAEKLGLTRVAILPRSDLGAMGADRDAELVLESVDHRLDHFGVRGVYVDHFSEIAQFLTEVRVAASSAQVGSYVSSGLEHRERLDGWWREWYGRASAPADYVALQSRHHEDLRGAVEDIRARLNSDDEQLKLELWLRWKPTEVPPVLRLWASSYAKFTSWEMAHNARLELDSPYWSVRAFSAGRVYYSPKHHPFLANRWKSFIAIPIWGGPGVDLVVGIAVLASMQPPEVSCLREDLRGTHAESLVVAHSVGALLLDARTP